MKNSSLKSAIVESYELANYLRFIGALFLITAKEISEINYKSKAKPEINKLKKT